MVDKSFLPVDNTENTLVCEPAVHVPLVAASWWLAGILILAGLLRVITLNSRGLEYDDAFSILLAGRSLASIVAGTAADTMPPLYYFLLHACLRLGDAAWLLRLPNVLLSLGIVVVTYKLVVALWDTPTGLLAAFFTAVSPFQIFHAQGMRMYVLLTLSSLIYAWCFIMISRLETGLGKAKQGESGFEKSREGAQAIKWWVGLVLSGTAAMYSHNLAIFLLVVPDFLLLFGRRWLPLRRLLAAQFVIGLLSLPWLVLVPGQVAKIQAAFWTPRPGFQEVIQLIVTFHTHLPVPLAFLPVALLISGEVLVFVILETFRRRRSDPGGLVLAGFALFPPVLLFLASYLMRPVFVPRPLMLSSLAYYGLLARGIIKARVRAIGYFVGLGYLAGALLVLPAQYRFESFPRSPFEEAVKSLEPALRPGDIVLHDNKLSFFPSFYYAPDLPQAFLADEPGSHNETLAPATQQALGMFPDPTIASAVGDAGRVWFVMFDRAQWEYQEMGLEHPVLEWLDARFQMEDRFHFNDLSLFLYTR